jgi:UDP-N-acetylmuramoyl-tripeptide--D-alanyl-D-alanine ligase
VALKGEQFDGHDFISQAFEKGAWGAFVQEEWHRAHADRLSRGIIVHDTLTAFQAIAAFWRQRHPVPLVGITGTNGKSTTKEMLAAILTLRGPVLKNAGNFNNHIGVPLTLLAFEADQWAAILEMGMSRVGEIRRLAEIARPTIGVITNVGPAHLATLGTLENVARAKAEILEGLTPDQIAVLNGDDPRVAPLVRRTQAKALTFRIHGEADLIARDLQIYNGRGIAFRLHRGSDETLIRLPVPGRHNVANALAAAAAATALGVDLETIRRGLDGFNPLSMRLEVRSVAGRRFINDAYNANPHSMASALETLESLKGTARAFLVIGDMLELGEYAREAHLELGASIARMAIDGLITFGELARYVAEGAAAAGMPAERITHCRDLETVRERVLAETKEGDLILVKGSRGMKMERVLEGVPAHPAGGPVRLGGEAA